VFRCGCRASDRDGRRGTFDVVEPEIIDAATATPQLSPRRRQVFQRFGIKSFVKHTLAK
jgi:hypothetical protein